MNAPLNLVKTEGAALILPDHFTAIALKITKELIVNQVSFFLSFL